MLKLKVTFSKFTLQFLKFIGIFSKICLLASLISASSHASLNCNSQLESMSIISMAEADVVTAAAGTVADDVVTTAARDEPAAYLRYAGLSVNSASANTVRQWTFGNAGILNIAISCLNVLSPA